MPERLITSKNAFFNVRPGAAYGPRKMPAVVDEARHPFVARYAKVSARYSSSPSLPDLWQKGYERFGDDYEAILTGIESNKPTEYAKALLQLDDLWKLVGLRWEELAPHEQLAWDHAKSESRNRALILVARRETPESFGEMLAWSGVNRVNAEHGKGWAESILATLFRKFAEKEHAYYHYKPQRAEVTPEELLAIAAAGIAPEELYHAMQKQNLTISQAHAHLTEGIPIEYVRTLV